MTRLAAVLAVVAACSVLGARAEISVDLNGSTVTGIYFVPVASSGGDGMNPWEGVAARSGIPAVQKLNINGGTGTHPDGWPSPAWDTNYSAVPEVAWAHWDGADYEIVVSRFTAGAWTTPLALTSTSGDESDPELAYTPTGSARIVYWSGSSAYMLLKPAGGSWGSPILIGSGNRPTTTGVETDRVAYQHVSGANVEVIAAVYSGGSWASTTVSSQSYNASGDIDVRMATASGQTWICWESGATQLAYSKLLANGTWTSVQYEATSGASDEEQGRLRVRSHVVP